MAGGAGEGGVRKWRGIPLRWIWRGEHFWRRVQKPAKGNSSGVVDKLGAPFLGNHLRNVPDPVAAWTAIHQSLSTLSTTHPLYRILYSHRIFPHLITDTFHKNAATSNIQCKPTAIPTAFLTRPQASPSPTSRHAITTQRSRATIHCKVK